MNFLPGPMELVLILIIVAMLFGVGKLPEVFGAVGKGIKEFRKEAGDELKGDKVVTPTVIEAPSAPITPAAYVAPTVPTATTAVPSNDNVETPVHAEQ